MDSLISRRTISGELIEEIFRAVEKGESALLLGPRYCGKTYVCDAVAERIQLAGMQSVALQFHPSAADSDGSLPGYTVLGPSGELIAKTDVKEFFSELGALYRKLERQVVLFLYGLDGLPRDSTRRFLQEIRAATNSRTTWLSAVITSETNILELVLGPKSEFTCARVYVLQSYSDEVFAKRFVQYAERVSIAFEHAENARAILRRSFGGSIYLLRQFFLKCSELRLVRGNLEARSNPFSAREIDEVADGLATPGVSECPSFRMTATLIEPDPESLQALDQLFAQSSKLAVKPGYPSRLELSGAVFNHEGTLAFSSPLMEAFLRREFSLARMADLHALAGNWELAFERYRHPSRPLIAHGLRGYQVRAAVLRKLREAFDQSPRERVEQLFDECLSSMFGIAAPTDVLRGGIHSRSTANDDRGRDEFDEQDFDKHGGRRYVSSSIRGGGEVTVKVPAALPAWLVAELDLVVGAYARAVGRLNAEEDHALLTSLHHSLTSTARDILRQVFRDKLAPSDTAEIVASRLRGGVKLIVDARVWLVSQGGRHRTVNGYPALSPAADDSKAGETVMQLLLSERSGEIPDETWRQIFGELPGAFHLLFPLESVQTTFGALAVRLDGSVRLSSAIEVELREFSAQVAGILGSAYESSRAWKALLHIAEPIIVLNGLSEVEFFNEPAKAIKAGFEHPGLAPLDFREGIEVAREQKHRYVNFPSRLGERSYEGAVVYEPLLDRDSLLGILIHIRQKSYYADILQATRALQRAGTREGALHELVGVFRALGHKWIRIYRTEGDRLIPDYSIDPERPHVEKEFYRIQLPLRDLSPSWLAISTGKPQVLSYQPEKEEGEIFVTAYGLPVYARKYPPEAELLGKKPEDYWIDFPLKEGDVCFGKLVIPCSDGLTPERFQMFEVLSGVVSETLQSMKLRPTNIEELERLRSDLYNSLSHLEVLGEVFERCVGDERFGTQDAKALRAAFQSAIRKHRSIVELTGEREEPV